MATGDDALAAGMQIMTGNELANTLDTEMNLTRDYIAQRTSTVTPVAKGGTGATTAAGARANLDAAKTAHPHTINDLYGDDGTTPYGPWLGGQLNRIDAKATNAGNVAANVADGILNTTSYNRTITGSYRVAYLGSTGLLGNVPSSRRYKKNIRPAEVDVDAVLALEVVTFLYRVNLDPTGTVEHGLIAEQVHDLGLHWLVDYGEDGTPEGVRYDRLALALLPALQSLHARLSALEERRDDA